MSESAGLRKSKDIQCGDMHLRITQLSAADGMPGLARWVRAFGDLLFAKTIEQQIAGLFCKLEDAEFLWLRAKFLENTKEIKVTEKGVELEVAVRIERFDGRLTDQVSWFMESGGHNFQDFLSAMGISLLLAAASIPARSPSPTPSTGSSGESSPPSASEPAS